jgi:hypothetical protein
VKSLLLAVVGLEPCGVLKRWEAIILLVAATVRLSFGLSEMGLLFLDNRQR